MTLTVLSGCKGRLAELTDMDERVIDGISRCSAGTP